MKKLLFIICALLTLAGVRAQDTCHITITGSFDSECQYDFKQLPVEEYPDILTACETNCHN